ncbi:FMN-binding protein [Phycicoccus sp. M110.8]|uniref:FMN-binding protein n=1 Tax=Phycicoccus sp. M110.8 TaxID=3075433 RepID=UPI0028FD20A2|nr:FMN-binding protein [Phycicoccus sp. M110.8]MDU0314498.1 FMN-binding protein [Phycicoccus sp. M110.8]
MRRITLWGLSTLTTLVLLFSYHTSTGAGTSLAAPVVAQSGSASGSSGSSGSSSSPTGSGSSGTSGSSGSSGSSSGSSGSSSSSSSGSSSSSATKTYDGDTAQTRWGPVQVRITVQGGKITNAEAIVYPNNNGRDVEINSYALPVLNQEAVQAQSANIDMVSGATVTSDGYLQSLQSAIDQAHL